MIWAVKPQEYMQYINTVLPYDVTLNKNILLLQAIPLGPGRVKTVSYENNFM